VAAAVNWIEVVQTTARNLGSLDSDGRLKALDSLTLIDFIVELETVGEIEIPSEALRADTFASIESVAQLLSELTRA
jgi:acyl carrier protein